MKIFLSLIFMTVAAATARAEIVVGSKANTESVLLGDILAVSGQAVGHDVRHWGGLGGTAVVWNALLEGEIDAYVDYTGTLSLAILKDDQAQGLQSIQQRLKEKFNIEVSAPLGFENSYAIGLSNEVAKRTGAKTITDLLGHPGLSFGFSAPFVEREDGWPGLKRLYGLQQSIQSVDHDLAYRGIETEQIDGMDVYTTDPEIHLLRMTVLEDDRGYFPDYSAVIVYRSDLIEKAPMFVAALNRLSGRIDTPRMRRMNEEVKVNGRSSLEVAVDFVEDITGQVLEAQEKESRAELVLKATLDHMILVGVSLTMALLVALPLGVYSFIRPRFGAAILSLVGILQTVPSLALFVFLIPVLGIGAAPAILALFLYSLLPVVRNTHAGLVSVPDELRRVADGLGMTGRQRFLLVELPMARATILAGIKTAAVINVGTATLGALIGAGGLGEPILTGIRLADTSLILLGAGPAAILALVVQGGFSWMEDRITPAGLKND